MDYSGRIIDDRYQLIRLISKGGMGAVYLARHVKMGGELAIKLLRPEFRNNKVVMTRFVREAQTVARINHRNVVDVFDMGFTDWKAPYIAMQYLRGHNVEQILDYVNRPLSISETCGIVLPVLCALHEIHTDGIIHRDIKPSNIVLAWTGCDYPIVKVIDFGISKVHRKGDAEITRERTMVGTMDYMSPEQMSGSASLEPNTDLWSVGVILYRMLTGKLPFAADVIYHVYLKIMSEDPTRSIEESGVIPKAVVSIMRKALARDPKVRYQTAFEMLKDLSSIEGCQQRNRALKYMVEGIPEAILADNRQIGAESVPLCDRLPSRMAGDGQPSKLEDDALDDRETPDLWSDFSITLIAPFHQKRRTGVIGLIIVTLLLSTLVAMRFLLGEKPVEMVLPAALNTLDDTEIQQGAEARCLGSDNLLVSGPLQGISGTPIRDDDLSMGDCRVTVRYQCN